MNDIGIIEISKESPVGNDVKYDDEYLEVVEEISYLDSLEFSKKIDYKKIKNKSISILKNKSKDIRVAIYLSISLTKIENILGFCKSIRVLKDMINKFSLSLFPISIVAKENAFRLWLNKILVILNNIDNYNLLKEEYHELFDDLKFIDDFLNTNLVKKISLSELFSLLDMKIIIKEVKNKKEENLIEEKKENLKKNSIKKPLNELSSNTKHNSKVYDSLENSDLKFVDIFDLLLKDLNNISSNLIENNQYNIFLFLLNRIKIWYDVDELPNHNENKTFILSPQTHEVDYLNKLYKEQNWDELLVESESRIFSNIFWLDLHFYVYVCLKHKQIKNINFYTSFLKLFLSKFPDLIYLKFENEFSFANNGTKLWLKELLIQKKESNEKFKNVDLKIGFELLDNNKNIEAADYFIEKINQTFSKKEQVTIILELIETFKDYKYKDLIYHYLDYLLEILEEFKLYKWDPSLAVKIYKVIINAMETIDYRIESTSFLKIKKKLLKLDFASYINLLNKDV